MTQNAVPFVEGWNFVQTLGEGTYGEVKLAMNVEMTEAVAVKIIELHKVQNCYDLIRKEVAIHRLLKHENIIQFFGTRKEAEHQYIFLAYASGGELFDRIEPDIGMAPFLAQNFFRQLLNGVGYLHSLGITHRDIKPENLLLDENDVLKIVDFGFATIFKHKGIERDITKSCGTPPYVSPEVLQHRPYKATPADIWSCGIVLVAMLTGELPWDEPCITCKEYSNWLDHDIQYSPWSKIPTLPLALLRKILVHDSAKRASIIDIKKDRWFNKKLQTKRKPSSSIESPYIKRNSLTVQCEESYATQPESSFQLNTSGVSDESVGCLLRVSLSQPTQTERLLLSTQCLGTPGSSQSALQRLGKRMTRFWSKKDAHNTVVEVQRACKQLEFSMKVLTPYELTFSTVDRRKQKLVFRVLVCAGANETLHGSPNSHRTLVDVRLSKGDGLEFKRCYDELTKKLYSLIF